MRPALPDLQLRLRKVWPSLIECPTVIWDYNPCLQEMSFSTTQSSDSMLGVQEKVTRHVSAVQPEPVQMTEVKLGPVTSHPPVHHRKAATPLSLEPSLFISSVWGQLLWHNGALWCRHPATSRVKDWSNVMLGEFMPLADLIAHKYLQKEKEGRQGKTSTQYPVGKNGFVNTETESNNKRCIMFLHFGNWLHW